jgi:polar amino acid transport system substrate-binding protein
VSKFKIAGIAILATAGLVAMTGCSSSTPTASSTPSTSASISVDAAAAALLPAQYKTAGVNVASDIPYAPMELFDANNNPTGFDYDLSQALGAKLGVTFKFEEQTFDSIIPSLQAGKHDVVMSSMTDSAERQKVLTFVDYFNAGSGILVPKGNPKNVTSFASLCGLNVAVENATTQADLVAALNKGACKSKPVVLTTYPDENAAETAIRAGKADADLNDGQVSAYNAKLAGNGAYFDVVTPTDAPDGFGASPIGIGTLKANTGLVAALKAALQSLQADGTYASLLAKWNLTAFGLTTITENGK